jgi:hypothetical protein
MTPQRLSSLARLRACVQRQVENMPVHFSFDGTDTTPIIQRNIFENIPKIL